MKSKTVIIGFILAAVVAVFAPPPACCRNELIDRIIARVNEEIITQRQFDAQKEQLSAQLAQKYSGQELDERVNAASKDLLRDMIDQDLLVQKAKDLNINADSEL